MGRIGVGRITEGESSIQARERVSGPGRTRDMSGTGPGARTCEGEEGLAGPAEGAGGGAETSGEREWSGSGDGGNESVGRGGRGEVEG